MPRSLEDKQALVAVGWTIAAIEADCSRSWPRCPRGSLICDCRLRAVRAVNALRLYLREEPS